MNSSFQKNSKDLDDGRMNSSVFSAKPHMDDDSGGKYLLVQLEKEDTLSVQLSSGNINEVTFCVQSPEFIITIHCNL